MSRTGSSPKRKTVLFVDDESLWRTTVQAAARGGPVHVVTAAGGAEALEELGRTRPDLILSDVRMPDMNGFDLFEKVRSDPKFASIPWVFMSSIDDFDARKTARDLGAEDYVEKPYDASVVTTMLSSLLERFTQG